MSKKTTLVLIGRGHWGQIYKKTINGMPGIFLPSEHIYGKDYKEGLKKTTIHDIDGVIVASTTSSHYGVASYLLTHGFHRLLIEKPLTKTSAQARKLQKLLHTVSEPVVLVGHVLLYDPAYNKMKEVAHNKLGKIVQINYSSLKTPPIKGATIVQDAGSPAIYLFMDFAHEKPTKVSARPTTYDNVELTLEFDNGLLGIANIGTIYPERKRKIIITGEKGKLVLTEFMDPRELLFIDNNNKKENLSFPTDRTPLEQELLEFVACISTGKSPKTPLSQGVDVVNIIEMAEKSLRKKGKPIPFEKS